MESETFRRRRQKVQLPLQQGLVSQVQDREHKVVNPSKTRSTTGKIGEQGWGRGYGITNGTGLSSTQRSREKAKAFAFFMLFCLHLRFPSHLLKYSMFLHDSFRVFKMNFSNQYLV